MVRLLSLPGVFRPRSDSWLLAEAARAAVTPGAAVLDLCTGSGVVAVSAALAGGDVTAVDVSRRAVLTARANGVLHGVRVRAVRGNLYAAVADRTFDLVTANPPYLPTPAGTAAPRGAARAWEGGHGGRELVDRIIAGAADALRPGGQLLLVHSDVCDLAATGAALATAGLVVDRAATHLGPYGPLVASRRDALVAQGLLERGREQEEVVVFRARRPAA